MNSVLSIIPYDESAKGMGYELSMWGAGTFTNKALKQDPFT
jgi:hypothetical protein